MKNKLTDLVLALSFALAGPLAAQTHSDVRIPLTKEQIPTVVRITHLDTLLFQPRDTVRIVDVHTLTQVDTVALVQLDTGRGSFPWWLGLVPAGAFVGATFGSHDHTPTPPDTLAPPVTVTPEPGTLALMASGLLLVGILSRRKTT